MADVQIVRNEVTAVPANYKVPHAGEFVLKTVYAEYFDNGAGEDWLPCVTILSDSGDVIARAVDQGVLVTAGFDADVTWFPGLKGSAGTAAAGRMPVIYLVGTASGVQSTTSGVGFNRQFYQASGFSYQPDPTVYSVNSLGGGLCDEVTFLEAGQYMITAGFIYESAAAFYREWSLNLSGTAGLPLVRDISTATRGADDVQRPLAQLYEATTAAVAGGFATAKVQGVQTSGGAIGVAEGYLSIIQLSSVAQ